MPQPNNSSESSAPITPNPDDNIDGMDFIIEVQQYLKETNGELSTDA